MRLAVDAVKPCSRCGEVKSTDQFGRRSDNPDLLQSHCIPCRREHKAEYYQKRKAEGNRARRNTWLLSNYGISLVEVEELAEQQGMRCAICQHECKMTGERGDKYIFQVDHDHTTGEVRGLLCSSCNIGIGCFRDDPELLEKTIRYLNA